MGPNTTKKNCTKRPKNVGQGHDSGESSGFTCALEVGGTTLNTDNRRNGGEGLDKRDREKDKKAADKDTKDSSTKEREKEKESGTQKNGDTDKSGDGNEGERADAQQRIGETTEKKSFVSTTGFFPLNLPITTLFIFRSA
ncbi:hypothetical protein TRVL_06696 [Trypanosoma vivax]|nr:hypothetical protein TRVL_06696 [Trypanosoma vivax]